MSMSKFISEKEALLFFNRFWIYLVVGCGGVVFILDTLGLDVDNWYKVICYMLIPAPVLRNLLRVSHKVRDKNWAEVGLLTVPVVVFLILMLKIL